MPGSSLVFTRTLHPDSIHMQRPEARLREDAHRRWPTMILLVSASAFLMVLSLPTVGFSQESHFARYPEWKAGVRANTQSVALGDVDLDGDLDLVCGNKYPSRNTLYLNTGGTFESSPSWSAGGGALTFGVGLGDVDGDGDLDFFCGNRGYQTLYSNTGGTFDTLPSWSSDWEAKTDCVALGDVDGDGDLDLVCGNIEQSNTLYLNTDGTFASSPSWSSGLADNTRGVALGDVDGDGDLDLVCGNDGNSTLYYNTGGTFESSPSWSSLLTENTESIALGDVDGDGDLDLVCGNYDGSNTLYVNTDGTFELLPSWSSGPEENTESIALGDVDGDGDLDLVCGNYDESSTLYLNIGGTFETSPSWSSGATENTRSVALGDIDGDGDLDLVFGNYDQSNTLYLNTGGAFGIVPSWSSIPTEVTQSVALGDVDGDGDPDLVCGNYDESSTLYLNTDGTLDALPSWSSGPTATTVSIALGDVDGDGDLDLVCGNAEQSNTLYLNAGGTFDALPSWSSGPTATTLSIALGDVDCDCDLDLVCGNDGNSTLYYNAGGTFDALPSWSSGPTATTRSIAMGDVDGDGDLDLVCGNAEQSNTLYLNAGGTFDALPSWSSGPTVATSDIALGDVDGDGDLDLVCGNYEQSNTLYFNTGGTFESSPSWSSMPMERTTSVALDDVDGDGDLDLVCGNRGESNTLYLNTDGTFEPYPQWSSSQWVSTQSVALADVDGDGDLDLVCGTSYQVPWFRESNAQYAGVAAPVFKGDPASPTNHLPNNGAHLRIVATDKTSPEYYRVSFTTRDVESDPIWLVADYQYEGDPAWRPAIMGGTSGKIGPFETSPTGVRNSIEWDVHLLSFTPREVILRLRVIEIPKRVSLIQHVAPYLKEVGPVTPYRPVISTEDVLSCPAVTLGDTTSVDVHVTNEGTATLTITNIGLPTPDIRLETTLPVSLAPGEGADLTLLLAPGTDADVSGNLVIESNDPFSPSTVVALTADVRPLDFTLANLYPMGEIAQGAALNISVTMQDYVQVDSARVLYREGGKALFYSILLQRIDDPVNDQYYGSSPSRAVAERGIEYFVEVHNGRFSEKGAVRQLRTRVKNASMAGTPPAGHYGMVSLPLEMEGPILGVLSDDLGGRDITNWRMWGYDGVKSKYTELPNDTTVHFELARGYWLITRNAPPIDTGPAEGLSTPVDGPFEITLGPGWSMIGNPFAFPVAWSAVAVDTLSMSVAQQQGVIEPLWRWVPSTGSYRQDVAVLEPFAGYWVRNVTDPPGNIVLRVSPVEADKGAVLAGLAARNAKKTEAWEIAVAAVCEDATVHHNAIGVQPDGRDTYDLHDRSEPPMGPGERLSLYFPHLGWDRHAGRYAVDVRGTDAEDDGGQVWVFDVAKNFAREAAGDEVVLEFQGIEDVPVEWEVMLVDRELGQRVALRTEPRYAFFLGQRGLVVSDEDARFALVVGSEAFVNAHEDDLPALPSSTALHQNRPNPFNPSTIIRYDLARPGRVTLRIYDVKGALVKSVEEESRPAGRYEVGWNGENDRGERVSSGVYFYQLKAPGYSQTRKMLILK